MAPKGIVLTCDDVVFATWCQTIKEVPRTEIGRCMDYDGGAWPQSTHTGGIARLLLTHDGHEFDILGIESPVRISEATGSKNILIVQWSAAQECESMFRSLVAITQPLVSLGSRIYECKNQRILGPIQLEELVQRYTAFTPD